MDFNLGQSSYQEYQTNNSSTNDYSTTNKKEFDKKYKLGLDRYNSFKSDGKHWFENSIFEKKKNLKDEFILYLSELIQLDFEDISIKLWSSFHSRLIDVKNKQENTISQKDATKEFLTLKSTINYFQDEIKKLEEGAKKFGDKPIEMIYLLTDIRNFFINLQTKELEN